MRDERFSRLLSNSTAVRQRSATAVRRPPTDPNPLVEKAFRVLYPARRPNRPMHRLRQWAYATRWRKRAIWLLLAFFVLFIFPGVLGAVATAQYGSAPASGIEALSWMDVRDSSGIRLTDYVYATREGSVLRPLDTVTSALIGLLFIGYLVIVTSAVWLIGYAISFRWLDPIGNVLAGAVDRLTSQLNTPLLITTAAAIGAFFVGWFIVRGYHGKATMQIVTMLGVALLSPFVLQDPLGHVLSSDGTLAQGRDLGVSVAAGLRGDSNPDPNQLIATMQIGLADGFGRGPAQVLNFGHVVDRSPSCRAAWSAGVRAGDEARILEAMRSCGDTTAYRTASNPSMAQVGSGLLLLISALLLLGSGGYLGIEVMHAAFDGFWHAFRLVLGVLMGGYIYGPTQIALIYDGVHVFIAALRMAGLIATLSLGVLIFEGLFDLADGQVTTVLVVGAVIMIFTIRQLRRLNAGMGRGQVWMTQRIASALQGSAGGGSGSGGPAAAGMGLGMGDANANNTMSTLGLLAAASTINNSPIAAWAAGGRLNPLMPWSFLDHRDRRNKARGLATRDMRAAAHGPLNDRVLAADIARAGMRNSGSHHRSERAAAFAAENVAHVTGLMGGVHYALRMAGVNWRRGYRATIARADIIRHADDEPLASKHLGRVLAAHKHFERDYLDPEWARPRLYGLEASVARYRGDYPGGVRLSNDLAALGSDYINNPTKQWIETLQAHVDGPITDPTAARIRLNGQELNQVDADRLRSWIANEHALRVQAATRWVAEDPTDFERIRTLRSEIDKAAQTDQWQAGRSTTGAVSLPQPNPTQGLQPIPDTLLDHFRRP
ncbi:hypothetical protein [Nocardia amamiensis]|uniref:hypothetical protein n=1 Tax=Nocardia amamiensis TaxID=404578 RepID=UPI00340E154A